MFDKNNAHLALRSPLVYRAVAAVDFHRASVNENGPPYWPPIRYPACCGKPDQLAWNVYLPPDLRSGSSAGIAAVNEVGTGDYSSTEARGGALLVGAVDGDGGGGGVEKEGEEDDDVGAVDGAAANGDGSVGGFHCRRAT